MTDLRAELVLWMEKVKAILIDRDVLNENGELSMGVGAHFPKEIEDTLDGFVENPIELMGLLTISKAASEGRPLSPAVLRAAHLMAREIFQLLQSAESANDNELPP